MVFVQTVREKIVGFYKKEIGAAKTARESQGFIGHTSEIYFKFMVSNNMIQNFPITASFITNYCSSELHLQYLDKLMSYIMCCLGRFNRLTV